MKARILHRALGVHTLTTTCLECGLKVVGNGEGMSDCRGPWLEQVEHVRCLPECKWSGEECLHDDDCPVGQAEDGGWLMSEADEADYPILDVGYVNDETGGRYQACWGDTRTTKDGEA